MRFPARAAVPLCALTAAVLNAAEPGTTLDDIPSRFATLAAARVHYKLAGRGRTALVFVHGWGGDLNVWREQVPHFVSKARLIVVDLPGHGRSDTPVVEYSMKHMARAIRAVLEDARIDRAVLIGHSAGTPVIRQFDRMFPARTRALVAVDGALRNPAPAAAGEKEVAAMRAADYRDAIVGILDSTTPSASPEIREAMKRSATALPQHVAVSFTAALFDPSIWKDDRIAVPLLVINHQSPMWSDEYVQAVRALADDVDYQTIDGVDQFLMLEKPDEFNSRLERWLVRERLLR